MFTQTTYYHTTALEDWVTDFYLKLNILTPQDIDEDYIAKEQRIFLHRKRMAPFFQVVGRYCGITIDIREPQDKQRETFFHELCHILRHTGNQGTMNTAFRQLQEWDTKHFTKYAAIPHHMIPFIPLKDDNVIDQMVHIFKVTPELCEERLIQIKKGISQKTLLYSC
ncbi:ImmA/IrrE family metallo-endopeptidase [Niallia taxi]|uniref:ImmA/IrrE family metallo-endopeptidase n=1 Tax=Niallia taxi TaxID=2499688 RepID=UPI0021A411F2|nr:ImmA/IrrE family metallo-endopeptidase [Niallia taxi]MCT2347148.1 ImmA/IrrE family metallo-endopeptidase [Niallia taxi]